MTDTRPAPDRSGLARLAIFGGLGLGALVFFMVLTASIRQTPGASGVMSGIAVGLFAGLMVAGAGAWLAMRLMAKPEPAPDTAVGGELAESLAPVLREIETTRVDLLRQAKARGRWRIPLCTLGGIALWATGLWSDDPIDYFDLLTMAGTGAIVGWGWAEFALSDQYNRLYRDRMLPLIATRYGDITYTRAVAPDLSALTAEHVFGDYDTAVAQNRLAGTHRGLPVDIYELALTKGSGDDRQTLFSGLMASVELPRSLRGTTAVIAEGDMFAPARDWMSGRGRLRVRIEDPEFEKAYQVYGTDQIAARALLTPAFIERFRAMATRSWAGRPLALVQDNRLTLAIPRIGDSLFAPPSFRAPAASREALARLYNDISEVLATADTVIDLDQAARATAH